MLTFEQLREAVDKLTITVNDKPNLNPLYSFTPPRIYGKNDCDTFFKFYEKHVLRYGLKIKAPFFLITFPI